jgi:hypothetical protein
MKTKENQLSLSTTLAPSTRGDNNHQTTTLFALFHLLLNSILMKDKVNKVGVRGAIFFTKVCPER